MRAIFVTEKEAREFITNNYGKDAIVKPSSVESDENFDIDDVPYSWGGETAAFEVNSGEAVVGYMEADSTYTVKFCNVTETTDSLYSARLIADEIKDLAENMNVTGVIVISDDISGEVDSEEVELYLEDEPAVTPEDFAKAWSRLKIGKLIREARQCHGISIRRLADLSGMSKNNVERIECGAYNYTIDNLIAILCALGMKIELK